MRKLYYLAFAAGMLFAFIGCQMPKREPMPPLTIPTTTTTTTLPVHSGLTVDIRFNLARPENLVCTGAKPTKLEPLPSGCSVALFMQVRKPSGEAMTLDGTHYVIVWDYTGSVSAREDENPWRRWLVVKGPAGPFTARATVTVLATGEVIVGTLSGHTK